MPDRLPRVHAAEHRNLPKERCCQFSQRVHVGIWYILRAQKGSHIPTLRPKYVPYTYMDPLGNIQNLHELRGLAFSLKKQALQATRGTILPSRYLRGLRLIPSLYKAPCQDLLFKYGYLKRPTDYGDYVEKTTYKSPRETTPDYAMQARGYTRNLSVSLPS